MPTMDFTVHLVTPAFLGGAQDSSGRVHTDPHGIRIPTLRGALEFWYRSLFGHLSGPEVYQRQARVFGSAAGGQGVRIRRLGSSKISPETLTFNGSNKYNMLYLGYGPLQFDSDSKKVDSQTGDHPRKVIPPKGRPWVSFEARGSHWQLRELRRALILLHLFGGLGARSRRGWGSVTVTNGDLSKPKDVTDGESSKPKKTIDGDPSKAGETPDLITPPGDFEKPEDWLRNGVAQAIDGLDHHPGQTTIRPRFTAFTQTTRAAIGPMRQGDPQLLLNDFAEAMKEVRGSYKETSDLTQEDIDLAKKDATQRGKTLHGVPKRLAFGLPYRPEKRRGKTTIWSIGYSRARKVGGKPKLLNARRASPVFFKVFPISSAFNRSITIFFDTHFFGDQNDRIGAEVRGRTLENLLPPPPECHNDEWPAIDELFEALQEKGCTEIPSLFKKSTP